MGHVRIHRPGNYQFITDNKEGEWKTYTYLDVEFRNTLAHMVLRKPELLIAGMWHVLKNYLFTKIYINLIVAFSSYTMW